jgi:hypothetical protein
MRRWFILLACSLALLLAPPHGPVLRAFTPATDQRAGDSEFDRLLRAAAEYLAGYERALTSVVAEEDYIQRLGAARGAPSRHLRSDLLLILDEHYGYVGFRDVFEVDGRLVRNREQRLASLFLKPHNNPFERARRIAEESARYNLDHDWVRIRRTINMPFTAMKFLRAQNQSRSAFRIDERLAQAEPATGDVPLAFAERRGLPLIDSPDKMPSRGVFWVDPDSGRVSRTELVARTGSTTIRIRVTYAPDEALGMWLPVTMEEEYLISARARIEGSARYANFRRFTVETSTEIDTP